MNTSNYVDRAHEPSPLHVAWSSHHALAAQRTGYTVDAADQDVPDGDEEHSKWEERFDICQLDAILHMLHHLTKNLPGFARRWVLRRASTLPHLHGHFGPMHGTLAFHAADSYEAIGMSTTWRVHADGTHEEMW